MGAEETSFIDVVSNDSDGDFLDEEDKGSDGVMLLRGLINICDTHQKYHRSQSRLLLTTLRIGFEV